MFLLLIPYVSNGVTFDPLTVHVCIIHALALTWSNSVPNFREIEQLAAELRQF